MFTAMLLCAALFDSPAAGAASAASQGSTAPKPSPPAALEPVTKDLEAKGWKITVERKTTEQQVVAWKKDGKGVPINGQGKLKFSWVIIAGPFDVMPDQPVEMKLLLKQSPVQYHKLIQPDEKEIYLQVHDAPARPGTENDCTSKLKSIIKAEMGLPTKVYIVQRKVELIEGMKLTHLWYEGEFAYTTFVKSKYGP
jgi:hypothetical protein